MAESDRQDFNVEDLWGYSTGGSQVADRPNSESTLTVPQGPRAAGVDVAMSWFLQTRISSMTPTFLFLIGGPGAGKSSAVAELVRDMTRTDSHGDQLAHRTYEYTSHAGDLRLVNDATIRKTSTSNIELHTDIDDCLSMSSDLVACVNRGILVEELQQSLTRDDAKSRAVVQWLHGDFRNENLNDEWSLVPDPANRDSFIQSCELFRGGQSVASIAAVHMDACSLLEAAPTAYLDDDGLIRIRDRYNVTLLSDRIGHPTLATPAGDLFGNVATALSDTWDGAVDPEHDPIRANLDSLSNFGVRSALLNLLRSSEIVTGQQLSYRELWGAIVRSIVGELPEQIDSNAIGTHISSILNGNDSTPTGRFEAMKRLASYRYSEGLFAQTTADSPRALTPLSQLLSAVDPLLDALPGNSLDRPIYGWATPVTDAFSGAVLEESPLQALREIPAVAGSVGFQTITAFDWALDKAYAEAMQVPGLKRKRLQEYVRWYGQYLLRLFAVANGIPAFVREVEAWTHAWQLSPLLPAADPINLARSFETLVRPPRDPSDSGSRRLVPIFESRVVPIQNAGLYPQIALAMDKMSPKTRRDKEKLTLVLDAEGAEIELNFPLVREALAHANGQFGVSEMAPFASPRLDRLRAADVHAHLGAWVGSRLMPASVSSEYPLGIEAD